jgi:hypothetical protein
MNCRRLCYDKYRGAASLSKMDGPQKNLEHVMPNEQIQSQALNSLGTLAIAAILLSGLVVVLLAFSNFRQSNNFERWGAFFVWGCLITCVVWYTFDPAIRAMKLVDSPAMFAVIGIITALFLFAVRRVRKDVYGVLEIAVAIANLLWLGGRYDAQTDVAIVISFIGAIYVIVRGLTNITEYWMTIDSAKTS